MAIDPSIGKAAQATDAAKKSLEARDVSKDVSGVAKEDAISKFNEMMKAQDPSLHSKDIPSHTVNIPDSPLQKGGPQGAHKLDSSFEMRQDFSIAGKSAAEQTGSKHNMLGSLVDATMGVKERYHASESKIMDIISKLDADPTSPMNQRMVLEIQNEVNVKSTLMGLASSVLKGVKDAVQGLLRAQ
ncbi:MAG: hypothetical protein COZ46_03455 [Verrucomicrobia bacterium CG_4_10_14_3_um_filter_43_23]|nr:MAG: hypothetical protein AUJ82_07695 [Verrucomicrobia bacterium CG1_02_43_26]PIP58655.1 MAG: hypothetical protein COX01_07920 [Verrucomicrobia bacterium CG22_combo_CG10-13_8_21_14_all_43_17]PIX58517.1 MAG: hypothetical protein COZ46_03455 [Verrucomicrobia bacterium CG_4_10_14_3_um_filter_43_23]PIY61249.1 MAG: hypothetical protein COY94_06570 [Verrucomicrobia bacterium CG_4_10_14_0_8_um_filter_43_34]PJA43557.1 MAG: hypothetical protein CO175_07445 [Verrucomicrobia bacterium CG_4_9_14_3_um_fi